MTFRQFFSQNVHHHLSLFVQIWVIRLSWALNSTVTISTRCNLRFLSYSLGQFSEVRLQRYFRCQNLYIYSTKRSKQSMWLADNESEYLIMTFISWPWMILTTWPWNLVFFYLAWPRMHLRFLILPLKILPMICLSRQKIKKVRSSSNFCIWRRYASVFCVYSKGEGKLVNISVSVDARRTILTPRSLKGYER